MFIILDMATWFDISGHSQGITILKIIEKIAIKLVCVIWLGS
jgi:hypothetical protein